MDIKRGVDEENGFCQNYFFQREGLSQQGRIAAVGNRV